MTMLKKNDLAKQFELLTLQEIKNYQDSLNIVLQSIRDLKNEIEDVKQQSLENHAAIHSVQCGMNIEIDHIRQDITMLRINYDNFIFDQRVLNERNSLLMCDMEDAIHRKIKCDSTFDEDVKNLSSEFNKVEEFSDNTRRLLDIKIDDLLCRFRQGIEKAKREILNTPTEASLVRNEMDEKIAAHKVDVAGIMRELIIFKKENVIIEKKLENIYTLIDRIQKKGQ